METYIKKEQMKSQKGYEVIIDRKKYIISTDTITGLSIKRIAGITERDDQIASANYCNRTSNIRGGTEIPKMGWFAFILMKSEPDEKLGDYDEVDLLDDGEQRQFFTACNGTYIIEEAK